MKKFEIGSDRAEQFNEKEIPIIKQKKVIKGIDEKELANLEVQQEQKDQIKIQECLKKLGIDGKEETKKKKTSLIAGAMVAGTILASAGEALATEKYVPDEGVVGQKEYVIPGVIERGKVPGAIEKGKVPGTIEEGKISREETVINNSEKQRETDLSNMRRGGNMVIDGREYNIDK